MLSWLKKIISLGCVEMENSFFIFESITCHEMKTFIIKEHENNNFERRFYVFTHIISPIAQVEKVTFMSSLKILVLQTQKTF
jgi:hypothetical protein